MKIEYLENIANILRRDVLEMTTAAGSGHPTSCLSCAEIMSVLFFYQTRYSFKYSNYGENDEFILSKGHAAPILYACLKRAGILKEDLKSLRRLSSPLEGHPMPSAKMPWIKFASGSLGQGVSIGVGTALAGKISRSSFKTFVLVGDSEMAEGSNYEAIQLAAHYLLDNLIVFVDANRLGQRGETMCGWRTEEYKKRFEAFGWNVTVVDGHLISDIIEALQKKIRGKPTAIIAKTVKGKGVSFLEDKEGWHGKVLNEEELKIALKEIPEVKMPKVKIEVSHICGGYDWKEYKKVKFEDNKFDKKEKFSTREAYGKTVAEIVKRDKKTIVLDAEVSNSTFTEEVKKVKIDQFVECYIAEQNMIGMCLGLSKRGFNVFGSTFAAFLSRAHDQIRMSALSNANFTLCGSHCGISVGEDGASQMGLEDIAMFRTIPNSIILYPSDAVSTEKLVRLAARTKGLKYLRTTRGKTSIIYSIKENFKLGDFKVIYSGTEDKIVLVGAGITLHECLKAYKILKKKRIHSAVIDLYCIKPFNSKKFISFVHEHGSKIIVVEDHYSQGGIGEMLAYETKNSGIRIESLAVRKIPHSGRPEELLKKYGIDAEAIYKTVMANKI